MRKGNYHKVITMISLILVIFLLVPSGVKLAHVFENHEHEVCIDNSTTHLHKIDIDCEFYKFNISNSLIIPTFYYKLNSLVRNLKQINSRLYNFEYNHQPLYFSLRAPPHSAA